MKTQAQTRRLAAWLVLCMAMLLLLSACPTALAAAAGAEADPARTGGLKLPLVDSPVTITWMVPSDVTNLNDLPVVKEISRRTGVTLNLMAYPKKMAEKAEHRSGKRQLPDIINGVPGGCNNYARWAPLPTSPRI